MSDLKNSPNDRLVIWLSWVLRHAPASSGVSLDEKGWASLQAVVAVIPTSLLGWMSPTLDEFREWIVSRAPGRFEVCNDQIRACYGHSVRGIEVARPAIPPRELFHGTNRRLLPVILAEGLHPMGRNRVHLTTDLNYARSVTGRFAEGLVLSVDTANSHRTGTLFFTTDSHVWQALAIAPKFLSTIEILSHEHQPARAVGGT